MLISAVAAPVLGVRVPKFGLSVASYIIQAYMNDLINGSLEILGAILLSGNCRLLYLHKCVKGISPGPTAFFCCWGLWNLWFYPANHLWFSFFGGICLAAVNVTWVAMAIHYSRQPKSVGRLVEQDFSFRIPRPHATELARSSQN